MKKVFLLLCFVLSVSLIAGQKVAVDDPNIHFTGTKYISKTEDGSLQLARFSPEIENTLLNGTWPERKEMGIAAPNAISTAGIVMSFKTASNKVKLSFKQRAKGVDRSAQFAVIQDRKWDREFSFKKGMKDMSLEITSKNPGQPVVYEVVFPSFSCPMLSAVELDDGASLLEYTPPKKKVYVAIGDSISHGTGQRSATYQTWPFKLSRSLGLELYSVAVGGGKISVPVAKMLKDWEKIHAITILIGYNDLFGEGKTVEQYKSKYNEMLDAIRANHPDTKVFCMTLLFTTNQKSEKTGHVPEEFRQAVRDIVAERKNAGDNNLFLVEGELLIAQEDLNDKVHLNIDGAEKLSKKMRDIVAPVIKK